MILKMKYSSSMLAPVYIDQIADIQPKSGTYYMAPRKGCNTWDVHTILHGKPDNTIIGIALEEDDLFLTGEIVPESCWKMEKRDKPENDPDVKFPLRVLVLTFRDGTTKHIYYPIDFFEVFIMSDEGKTIDRLRK